VAVHSILPPDLTAAVDEVLSAAGITHVAHSDSDPIGAAERAAGDPEARAVIGPFRSADVNEALAATATTSRVAMTRRSTTARCSGLSRATWSWPSGSPSV
jgi:hypothetical protein